MKESLQRLDSNQPGRLILKKLSGWYEYGRIPYKIWYDFKCSTGELVDEKNPATFQITQDLGSAGGGGESLSIFIHKSVLKEYRDVVFFHELTEAELVFADGINKHEAHQQTIKKTEEYAKRYLPNEEFEKFLEWQKGLDTY
jgi:hypothetical protein